MSNGIRINTIRYPDGDKKFVLTIFLDDKDSDWVEFDKEQLEGLVVMFQERLAEHDVVEEKQND
jgi:hypothetical protein